MKSKIFFFLTAVFVLSSFLSCNSDDIAPEDDFSQQIQGQWLYVAFSGGIAGFPETAADEPVVIEFTSDNKYRVYELDVTTSALTLISEQSYNIEYRKSSINTQSYYFLDSSSDITLSLFENRLILGGDHVDGMAFYYEKYPQ